MKHYIGVKRVIAQPMNRLAYNQYRGWKLPEDENGEDEGYLIEYLDGGESNHGLHKGYISWSPKQVFDNAYREVEYLSFSTALELLKQGFKIARAGWNGKSMWLCLSGPLGGRKINAPSFWSSHCQNFAEENGGFATVLPCINMKTADGSILMGWLASQTDMLSDDWVIVE